jgi:RNA polymerase sigma-70 factor (ECF subfamily)
MIKSDDLAQIIIGCKNRDSKCFSQIVDMYASRCYGYFYRLTGNNDVSDELLSELFVKLVEKVASYKGGSFDGWLFKIAANIFHDYLRSKQRDTDTRELIMLRFYSELSFKEIAQMRSEPIGTTLAKLHRGLKKLRELMR